MTKYDDVAVFQKTMHDVPMYMPNWPEDKDTVRKCVDLLTEEYIEVLHAIQAKDIVNLAQELVDVAYSAMSIAVNFGIPFDDIWREVHRANMTKQPNPDGGKALKGEGFQKANVKAIMNYGDKV